MIPILITMTSMLAFLIVGTISLRRTLFLLVGLLPFLPYYFAIPVGGSSGGAGFAAARGATYIVFLLVAASIFVNPRGWAPAFAAIRQNRTFVWLFITLSIARLASTMLSQPLGALYYWADELILLVTMLLLSTRVFLEPSNLKTLGWLFLCVAIINAGLAILETLVLNRHLLAGVVNIEVSTVGENVLEGRVRNDMHRAQVLFDNPLSLDEYLLYAFGAILFLYKPSKSRGAVVWFALALVSLGIMQTAARTPFVLLSAVFLVYWSLKFNSRLRSSQRAFYSALLTVVALTSTFFVLYFLLNFQTFLSTIEAVFFTDDNLQGQASVISRGLQYGFITQEIFSNSFGGILGEGYRSDVIEMLGVRLDNYYLRLLIEGGMAAVTSFLLMLVGLVLNSAANFRKIRHLDLSPADRRFFQRFFLNNIFFFSMFAFAKFFLSMNFNNYLLFLFAGAQFAVSHRLFTERGPRRFHPTQPIEDQSIARTPRS